MTETHQAVQEPLTPTAALPSLSRLAPGAVVTIAAKVVAVAALFAFQVALSRTLGAQRFGAFSLGLTVTHVLAIPCRLGLDYGALRFVAQYQADSSPEKIRALLRLMSRAVFAVSGVCVLVALAAAFTFLQPTNYGIALTGPRLCLILSLPFMAFASVLIAFLRGAKKVTEAAVLEGFVQPLLCLTLILVGSWWRAESALSLGFLLSWVCACGLAWRQVNALEEVRSGKGDASARCAEVLPFSLLLMVINAVDALMISMDVLLLGHFRSDAEVGYYVAAQRTTIGLTLILIAANVAFAPLIPQYLQEGAREKLEHLYRTVVRWVFMLSSPLAVVLIICPQVILVPFGQGFAESSRQSLIILTLARWGFVAAGMASYFLMMSGNQRLIFFNSVSALLMSIALHCFLIPQYGAVGAATGTAVVTAVFGVVIPVEVWRTLRLCPCDARWMRTVAVAAACAAVLRLLLTMLPTGVAIVGTLLVYVVVLWGFGWDGDDHEAWHTFKRAVAAWRSGS